MDNATNLELFKIDTTTCRKSLICMGITMQIVKKVFFFLLLIFYSTNSFGQDANLPVQKTFNNSNDRVMLQLIWKNQFQFAGYYAAKELGFYKDAGLDVTVNEYEFGTDVTGDVVSGKAQFGVGHSSLLLESMEGKPVHLLSAIYQHSPFMLLAKKRADLKTIQDLKGKRIMMTGDMVGMASLNVMLVTNKINPGDYTLQRHSFNVDDLISGNTDAMAAYISNEPYHMEKQNVEYTILSPRDHGYDFYSDILFTSQKLFEDNPELVERFHKTSLKGWEYAFSHIDEIIEIILKKYNTQNRTKEALLFEANTLKTLVFDGDTPLGNINKERLTQIAQVYRLMGLTNKPLKTDNLIFNSKVNKRLELTTEENAWLDEQHTVKARVGQSPPLHFFDGKFQGISVEYLDLIAKRAGFKVQYVKDIPWSDALENIKNHEINDLLLTAKVTQARKTFMNFTTNYLLMPWVIFTQRDRPVDSIEALINKTISVERNYVMHKKLIAEYPGIKLLVKESSKEAIEAIATGQADAYIGSLTTGSYIIQQNNFINLKVSAPTPFDNHNQAMAVRNDWPELTGIINKTFDSITPQEHTDIKKKWFSAGYERKTESAQKNVPDRETIDLTATEKAWLAKHPQIRVHNEMDWPPFNFFEYGKPKGLSIDYMNLLAERLGIQIKYITGPSWNEFLGMVQNKELDVMLNIVKTEARQKYLLYTEPYVKNPNVIVSGEQKLYDSIEQLFGKTVAIPKGFFYEEILTKSFPQINRLLLEDTLACLKAVNFGKADAALGEEAVIRSMMVRNMLSGLFISGEVKIGNPDIVNLRLGIRDDLPLLQSSLMKAMDSISEARMNELKRKWLMQTQQQATRIPLTMEEQTWLKNHSKIKVNGGEWPPFIIKTENRETTGISTQILDLAASLVGLSVEYIDGPWASMLTMLKKGDLDLLQCVSKTPERESYIHFTSSYLNLADAIFVLKNNTDIHTLDDLNGKTLAIEQSTHLHERLKNLFPDIRLLPVKSTLTGLQSVIDKKAAAFIGAQIVTQYEMQKRLITNLKTAAYFDEATNDLRLGAGPDNATLAFIMQKALDAITEDQKQKILSKYIALIDEGIVDAEVEHETGNSYQRLAIYGIGIFLLVSLLFFLLIRIMKRENIALSFGSVWFRRLVLVGVSFAIVMIALASWFTLEKIKKQHLMEEKDNLTVSLYAIKDRLDLWLEERISTMKYLSQSPELVAIAKRLLDVAPDQDKLLTSQELADVRLFFKQNKDIFGNIGFFIINPDYISIGSMRDANIGTRNLIADQHPELLKRAFQGEAGFIPPITSDVHLEKLLDPSTVRKPPTMFFISPIKDADGRVLAVMTLRLDPQQDLARITRPIGLLKMREAYAFDQKGRMLTPSRFEDKLRRIGLLIENQSSALNIEIRDPGVNLIAGSPSRLKRKEQPLTYMASQAIAHRHQTPVEGLKTENVSIGTNMAGYRDYRGVPVFGAWFWNHALDIGLAIEIDVSEALFNYQQVRMIFIGILGFTLLLSTGSVLLVLVLGERTSRTLVKARDQLEEKVDERTAELQENQERFAALLESAPDAMVVSNQTGEIVLVNSQTEKLFGYDRTELLGNSVELLVPENKRKSHPDNRQHFLSNAIVGQMGSKIMELQAQAKDGVLIPVDISLSPIETASGILVVASIRDITERKAAEIDLMRTKEEAETAREQAEARSRELVDLVHGLPIPTALFDPEGAVMVINQAFTSLLGYTIEDIPDVDAHWALFYPDLNYREQTKKDWTARVENSAKTGSPIEPMDLSVTSKSGQMYDLQAHTVQIGRVAATMWVNFTEQKQMEKAISAERERLQQILDTSPVGVAFSTKGKILFTNPMLEKMFDVKVGDTSPDLYVNPEERDLLVKKLAKGETVKNHELKMFGHNQDIRDMLANYMPITYDGEDGILGWLLDITDRKKAEQEIKNKFDELNRFRKLAVGREKKMIELKKEINELADQLGKDQRYKIV
jgi:PAS domain S-box-containing protein